MVEHQPSKLDTWVRFPSPAVFYFPESRRVCLQALLVRREFAGKLFFIWWDKIKFLFSIKE